MDHDITIEVRCIFCSWTTRVTGRMAVEKPQQLLTTRGQQALATHIRRVHFEEYKKMHGIYTERKK